VNVESSQGPGDYCFHFFDGAIASNAFRGRVFVKRVPATQNIFFGLQFGATANAIYTSTSYARRTNHLIVLKYTFVDGASNDQVALFVDPVVAGGEPAATLVTTDATQADAVNLDGVAIRQGDLSSAPTLQFDGIRVATNWLDATGGSTVTTSAVPPAGGAISPAGPVQIPCGGSQVFTIAANPCYALGDVQVDGVSVGPVSSYTVNNTDGLDRTIAATFSNLAYLIAASTGTGGGISPVGETFVACGSDQSYAITPNACHSIASVLVDGNPIGAVASYTFPNVQANHTISVTFNANGPYTITASAGPGGLISPSGAVAVACGGSQTFWITASSCYAIADVFVDDDNWIGAAANYSFANVQANHTISASFARPGPSIIPPVSTPIACGSTGNQLCASFPSDMSETYGASLNGFQVVPQVGTGASGVGQFTLDSTNVLHYSVVVIGLSGIVTAVHLHGPATPGVNAGAFANLDVLPGNTITGLLPLSSLQVSNLRNGLVYVNIHTPAYPGGEIRGQLVSASYAKWSVNSQDAGWAITGGQGTRCITYTAGNGGGALFKIVTVTMAGCSDSSTLALGCGALAGVETPAEAMTRFRDVTPNPMQGATRIDYALATAGPANIDVFSLSGQRVRTLATGAHPAGPGSVTWDGRSESGARLAAGAYVVRLTASGSTFSHKIVLLR